MLYKHRDVRRKFYIFFFLISELWFIESAEFEIVLEFNSSVLIFPGSIWVQTHVESGYEIKYEIELNHFKPLSCG